MPDSTGSNSDRQLLSHHPVRYDLKHQFQDMYIASVSFLDAMMSLK